MYFPVFPGYRILNTTRRSKRNSHYVFFPFLPLPLPRNASKSHGRGPSYNERILREHITFINEFTTCVFENYKLIHSCTNQKVES